MANGVYKIDFSSLKQELYTEFYLFYQLVLSKANLSLFNAV